MDRALADWKRERPDLDVSALRVIGRLKQATEIVISGLDRYFLEHGLTLADFEILAALRRDGKPYRMTQRELGTRVVRTAGTVTTRVDRLAKAGLVERHVHPTDRRAALVGLTRRGSAMFDQVVVGHLENERALLSGLTRTEQRTLAALLTKLISGARTSDGKA